MYGEPRYKEFSRKFPDVFGHRFERCIMFTPPMFVLRHNIPKKHPNSLTQKSAVNPFSLQQIPLGLLEGSLQNMVEGIK